MPVVIQMQVDTLVIQIYTTLTITMYIYMYLVGSNFDIPILYC